MSEINDKPEEQPVPQRFDGPPSVIPDGYTLSTFLAQAAMKFATQPHKIDEWKQYVHDAQIEAGNTEENAKFVFGIDAEQLHKYMEGAAWFMMDGLAQFQAMERLQKAMQSVEPVAVFDTLSSLFSLPPDVEGEPPVDTETNGPVG
jgi:hypothetical protein